MGESKKCTKCGEVKPLTSFHKNNSRDGRNSKCALCYNTAKNKAYSERPEMRERIMSRTSGDVLVRIDNKKKSNKNKSKIRASYYSNTEKKKASRATRSFYRQEGYELHHWSYKDEHLKDIISIPIEVHRILHTNLIYDKELLCYRTKAGELLDTKEKHIEFIGFLTNYLKVVIGAVLDM